MTSTGFWPVKSRLKEVIDYAENPDKTTDKRFLDEDLWAALRYAENDRKTDRTMYVSGINCPKQRAYHCMMATKRRYGKLGGNVAYHGYQSFASGEVTPEEAHKIGVEEYRLLCDSNIQSPKELLLFQEDLSARIAALEKERYALRLKLRRVKSPEDGISLKEQAKEITKRITPLRKELQIAKGIEAHIPRIKELLDAERQIEMKHNNLILKKERGNER